MNIRMITISGWLPFLLFNWSVSCYCQSSTSYQLKKWSISSGGGVVNSSSFLLKEATFGGLAVGKSESNSFILNGSHFLTAVSESNLSNSLIQKVFLLQQNYPNPFNPTTTIQYSLPKSSEVKIRIFNPMGQVIQTLVQEDQQPGNYNVTWDGKTTQGQLVPSGVYYYQIIAEGFTDVKKMLLIK